MVRQGIDPSEHRRHRQREASELAFNAYAQRFLDSYVRLEWPSSYGFAEGILRLHVTPTLRARALPSISRADVAQILDQLPEGKQALRRNVYAVIRRLFRWAVARGDLDRSPLDHFEAPSSVASRDRVLSDQELVIVWRAASKLGYPFEPLFKLLILTGQRREEVAALRWEELDRCSEQWTLPAHRAKNGRAHIVPLSSHATSILDGVAGSNHWPPHGYVFTTTARSPVSGYSKAKARLDRAVEKRLEGDCGEAEGQLSGPFAPWRIHDFRRTLATGLQRLGVRFEVTEAILNHVSGSRSGVAGVYQRYDWAAEKRAALDAWARHLESTLTPAVDTNIVSIASRRA